MALAATVSLWLPTLVRWHAAHVYAAVGDRDATIAELPALLAVPSEISVPALRTDPDWDSLRTHPRFQRLLTESR